MKTPRSEDGHGSDSCPRSEVDALIQAEGDGVPKLYRWEADENGRIKSIITEFGGRLVLPEAAVGVPVRAHGHRAGAVDQDWVAAYMLGHGMLSLTLPIALVFWSCCKRISWRGFRQFMGGSRVHSE